LAADQGRSQLIAKADTETNIASLGKIHARVVDLDAYSGEIPDYCGKKKEAVKILL
jgi:hypothetical protein